MKVLLGSKVEYYDRKLHREPGKPHTYKKELQGTATFLQFGSDSAEGDTFSTAIIRLDDGSLKNIYVEFIKFIEV